MADNRHIIKYKKICATCGKEFGTWSNNQRYCCEECKRYSRVKNVEAYKEKQEKKKLKYEAEQKKKHAVIDIAVEARKAGMSYGKYVAMMKL